jgi:hypothetical protein
MLRRLTLAVALTAALPAAPALAQEANLSVTPEGATGSAAQLVLAQRAYELALQQGEVLPLLSAIRLARGVTLRPATGWELTAGSEALPDAQPDAGSSSDPASEAALEIARNLAGEDPDLQDLVYDLDAQLDRGRTLTAVEARSGLGPGQSDVWRLPLFGEVSSEIALIGDGKGALALGVADDGGAAVCVHPASPHPALCRLTPARNGFFTITVHNPGQTSASYRLIGN